MDGGGPARAAFLTRSSYTPGDCKLRGRCHARLVAVATQKLGYLSAGTYGFRGVCVDAGSFFSRHPTVPHGLRPFGERWCFPRGRAFHFRLLMCIAALFLSRSRFPLKQPPLFRPLSWPRKLGDTCTPFLASRSECIHPSQRTAAANTNIHAFSCAHACFAALARGQPSSMLLSSTG